MVGRWFPWKHEKEEGWNTRVVRSLGIYKFFLFLLPHSQILTILQKLGRFNLVKQKYLTNFKG